MRLGKLECISPEGLRVNFEAANADGELIVQPVPDMGINYVRDSGLPPHVEGEQKAPRVMGQIPLSWAIILHWEQDSPA